MLYKNKNSFKEAAGFTLLPFPTFKVFVSSIGSMKCYLYFIFLTLLSCASFGQDSPLFKTLQEYGQVRGVNLDSIKTSLNNQRDHALVFIDTVSVMEQASQGKSGYENLGALIKKHDVIGKDTIYLYVNEYEISKAEIDSIWQAVFESARTQSLLKAYLEKEQHAIFLPGSYVNLLSVFKSRQIAYETKQHLLVDKICFDDQAIQKTKRVNTNNPPFPKGSYQAGGRMPMPPEPEYPYLVTIPFESKE